MKLQYYAELAFPRVIMPRMYIFEDKSMFFQPLVVPFMWLSFCPVHMYMFVYMYLNLCVCACTYMCEHECEFLCA